ncbi:hypothetical protein BT96DRAFT_1000912 [Gymnopus androsaceus JB14]|uniref:Uncharacterized protein n=1 Tax=Gymnopus androsaceus JB14 TaxID=1447944 RepID=A0A6A4H2G3_9AGAR|nr:hypothetical protein BT96DRAFT_1000912 [Gymnopus androsaceus JB14]
MLAKDTDIYHLACPASPPHYPFNAFKTVKTSFMVTQPKSTPLTSNYVYCDPPTSSKPQLTLALNALLPSLNSSSSSSCSQQLTNTP